MVRNWLAALALSALTILHSAVAHADASFPPPPEYGAGVFVALQQPIIGSGSVLAVPLSADNGVVVTNGTGIPTVSTTLPNNLTIPSPALTGTTTAALTGTGNVLSISKTDDSPSGIDATIGLTNVCLGNNSTFIGCSGGFITSNDDASVTTSTKGVLYGLQLSVRPLIARNNSPYDDATGLVIQNDAPGQYIATDAFYLGHNSIFTSGAKEWQTGFQEAANVNSAFAVAGGATVGTGLDLCWGGCATVGTGVRTPNNIPSIVGRNAAGTGDIEIARVNSSNNVLLGGQLTINTSTGNTTFSAALGASVDDTINIGGTGGRFAAVYSQSWADDNGSHNWTMNGTSSPTGSTGNLTFSNDGTTWLTINNSGTGSGASANGLVTVAASMVIGAPTGGSEGSHSLNIAGNYYANGTKVIDSTGNGFFNGLIASGAAATSGSSQIAYGGTTASSSSCGSLSGAAGCVVINVAGTTHYLPYY